MNEVLLSGGTVVIRDRRSGDITTWHYNDESIARRIAEAVGGGTVTCV